MRKSRENVYLLGDGKGRRKQGEGWVVGRAGVVGTVKEQGEMGYQPSQTGCEEWLASRAEQCRSKMNRSHDLSLPNTGLRNAFKSRGKL